MIRIAEENLRFDVHPLHTKRAKNRRVRMTLGGSTYYLDRHEAFSLANRLVDVAERLDEEVDHATE